MCLLQTSLKQYLRYKNSSIEEAWFEVELQNIYINKGYLKPLSWNKHDAQGLYIVNALIMTCFN